MHSAEDDQSGPFPAHLKQRSLQREFTSSEPKVNKYKWLGLAKRWKKEQIGSTTPMGKSLPQNISFTGSTLIWKKNAPLKPKTPDHHSHDWLLEKNLSTDLRSIVSIKKQRQSLSVVLVFSYMSYCQQGLGRYFACPVWVFVISWRDWANSEEHKLIIKCQDSPVKFFYPSANLESANLHFFFFFFFPEFGSC